jgi:hypothetical protein
MDDGIIAPEDSISMVGAPAHGAGPASPAGTILRMQRAVATAPHVKQGALGAAAARAGLLVVKMHDDQFGNVHRVQCSPADGWTALREALQKRLGNSSGSQLRAVVYTDDEGDLVAIDSDDSLHEAAQNAWAGGDDRLTVRPVMDSSGLGSTSVPLRPATSEEHAAAALARRSAAKHKKEQEQERLRRRRMGEHDGSVAPRQLQGAPSEPGMGAVTSFLGGLLAASSIAVGAGIVMAAKAARR